MARTAPPTTAGKARDARGFIYLALLLVVATLGAGLAAAATVWQQASQRQKEAELLFIGQQYRQAIRSYYETPAGGFQYPPSLEALLQDPRTPAVRRHLRRPYRDPLTGGTEWGLVMAPQGGIMGIYSLSSDKPIKRANFPEALGWSEGMESYADWKFFYLPTVRVAPGAGAAR